MNDGNRQNLVIEIMDMICEQGCKYSVPRDCNISIPPYADIHLALHDFAHLQGRGTVVYYCLEHLQHASTDTGIARPSRIVLTV
jgi:hypothetical protein